MAQIANLVLQNSASANVTFVPYLPQQGNSAPATWLEKSSGNPLGYRKVTMSVKYVANGVSKVRFRIEDPVLAALGSNCCVDANTPIVSYTTLVDMTFSIPSSAGLTQRKDILSYASTLLGSTAAIVAVQGLEPAF